MKIKEEYEKIKVKYGFPEFGEIDEEFEISSIDFDKVNSLTRTVLRVMCNKMVIFLNYIEPVINPGQQNLHSFIEVENTTNEEKKEIFVFYKNLSYRYHKACGIELTQDEKTVAKEIKEILKDWRDIKVKFESISNVITKSWLREREKEERENVG